MSLLIVIIVAVLLYVIVSYNGMIKIRNQVKEAWADIDVQLKRRYNLIPNIVETVKGYASHESEVFTKVTEARANAINASGIHDQGAAENMLSGALKSLFAVAENYPELKANENFMQLQNELVDTEDKIQSARRFYNSVTRDFNTKIQQFPAKIVAMMFAFKAEEFFEVEKEEEREVVDVDFSKEKPAEQPKNTAEPSGDAVGAGHVQPTKNEGKKEPKEDAPEQSVDKDMEEGAEKAAVGGAHVHPDEKNEEGAHVPPADQPAPADEPKEEDEEEKKDDPGQATMSL